MPRDGTGASDNVVEAGENLIHGAGAGDVSTWYVWMLLVASLNKPQAAGSGVDRSSKAAPAPDHEKGEAFEGLGGSGAGDSGASGNTGSGKGSEDVTVDRKVAGEAKS